VRAGSRGGDRSGEVAVPAQVGRLLRQSARTDQKAGHPPEPGREARVARWLSREVAWCRCRGVGRRLEAARDNAYEAPPAPPAQRLGHGGRSSCGHGGPRSAFDPRQSARSSAFDHVHGVTGEPTDDVAALDIHALGVTRRDLALPTDAFPAEVVEEVVVVPHRTHRVSGS
jgi:hypothetical protein